MLTIVIVGSGLAGYSVAREFRKRNKQTPLIVVSSDGAHFYSKPTLSNALALGLLPGEIPLNTAQEMCEKLNATVIPNARVDAIDARAHQARVDGKWMGYSSLVLAVGARQIRVPIPGDAGSRVLSVNDLDDYQAFREAIAGKRRVAIIGAGLIGCEFANDLVHAKYEVAVIDVACHPLPRLLPEQGGQFLQARLADEGVKWHLGTSVVQIDASSAGVLVRLANGLSFETDVVLSAVGLKPRLGLARAAGLAVEHGIVVNRYLETSAQDVYALGDCAQVDGVILPFVLPITRAARALAATLSGSRTPVTYPAMSVVVKIPACPTIVAPPAYGARGTWNVEGDEGGISAVFCQEAGRHLGFALLGTATNKSSELLQHLPAILA